MSPQFCPFNSFCVHQEGLHKGQWGGTGSWCEESRWIGQTGGRQRGEDRQRGQAERGEKAEKERQRQGGDSDKGRQRMLREVGEKIRLKGREEMTGYRDVEEYRGRESVERAEMQREGGETQRNIEVERVQRNFCIFY